MTLVEGKVRFAVVGCGRIGLRHADLIVKNNEAELVALCDVFPADERVTSYNVPYYDSFEKFIEATPQADVVVVASPNGKHTQHANEALKRGYHIVLEKPIALTKSDAESIIYTALRNSRHVLAVMQNRYSPPSIWLKELVDSGKLGEIYMVHIDCFWNRDERYYNNGNWHGTREEDGGTLFTQFSHFIDVMYWLFGDIENIQTRLRDFNHKDLTDFEDSGTVSFDFVRQGIGTINFSTSCWDKNFESSLTIIAEKGTVKVSGQYMNEIEYCHVKDYKMPELPPSNPPNDYGSYKGSAANHIYIIENTIDVLKGRDTITTNALEGLKVVDIIERIYKAAQ